MTGYATGAGPAFAAAGAMEMEWVFALYREQYFDLNVQHFHEKHGAI